MEMRAHVTDRYHSSLGSGPQGPPATPGLIPDIPEAARDCLPDPCGRPWNAAAFRAAAGPRPPAEGRSNNKTRQQRPAVTQRSGSTAESDSHRKGMLPPPPPLLPPRSPLFDSCERRHHPFFPWDPTNHHQQYPPLWPRVAQRFPGPRAGLVVPPGTALIPAPPVWGGGGGGTTRGRTPGSPSGEKPRPHSPLTSIRSLDDSGSRRDPVQELGANPAPHHFRTR
ncbi:unnamed protein product [Gadus morhua 'NCC']